MTIRIWRSYSCNNSSSFRLVARFSDPKTAAEAAAELNAFFPAHAAEMDAAIEETEEVPGEPSGAERALGEKYGVNWTEPLFWGDSGLEGDEPTACAEGGVLVVYHPYCSGFGDNLPALLAARGASVEGEDMDRPTVSVMFQVPEGAGALTRELDALFRQAKDHKYLNDWPTKPAWAGEEQPDGHSTDTAYFCDGKTAGFYIGVTPDLLPPLRKYLSKAGVKDPAIRLCEYKDLARFRAIADARCTACGATLTYIEPREHGVATEQLACEKCSGMFDLSTFIKSE